MWQAAKYIQKLDPAAKSVWEVLLTYPGFHALGWYRLSHWLYQHHAHLLAALVASLGPLFLPRWKSTRRRRLATTSLLIMVTAW